MSNFKNLIAVLQSANPKKNVTEAQVRKAIEDGQIKKPLHPFLWAKEEVEAAAKALGLAVPSEAEIEASFPGSMSLKAYRKLMAAEPAPRIRVKERRTDVQKPEGLSDEAFALLDLIWSYPVDLPLSELLCPRNLGVFEATDRARGNAAALTELISRGLAMIWVVDRWAESAVEDAIELIEGFDPRDQGHLDLLAEYSHRLKSGDDRYLLTKGQVRLVSVAVATVAGAEVFEPEEALAN